MFVDVTSPSPTHPHTSTEKRIIMTFDTTGLTEVKMMRRNGWQGAKYYREGELVGKTCPQCRRAKSRLEFYRLKDTPSNRKKNPSLLSGRCVPCSRTHAKAYQEQRRAADPAYAPGVQARQVAGFRGRSNCEVLAVQQESFPEGFKVCPECGLESPLSEYHSDRTRRDGLDYRCGPCATAKSKERRMKPFLEYWKGMGIPARCIYCAGAFEDADHLVPRRLGGPDVFSNLRPSCAKHNRSKNKRPLEEFIFSVDHPTKSRGEILHEIVMSGTWPFSLTTPEEFVSAFQAYEKEAISVL